MPFFSFVSMPAVLRYKPDGFWRGGTACAGRLEWWSIEVYLAGGTIRPNRRNRGIAAAGVEPLRRASTTQAYTNSVKDIMDA
jgi:hypothetical protein